jgi:hypothetical protein
MTELVTVRTERAPTDGRGGLHHRRTLAVLMPLELASPRHGRDEQQQLALRLEHGEVAVISVVLGWQWLLNADDTERGRHTNTPRMLRHVCGESIVGGRERDATQLAKQICWLRCIGRQTEAGQCDTRCSTVRSGDKPQSERVDEGLRCRCCVGGCVCVLRVCLFLCDAQRLEPRQRVNRRQLLVVLACQAEQQCNQRVT